MKFRYKIPTNSNRQNPSDPDQVLRRNELLIMNKCCLEDSANASTCNRNKKIFGNTYLKVDINGKMRSVSHSLSYKGGELVA
jgi:hypothetical protein